MADVEYRVNFLLRIVTDVLWYLAQIVVIEVLFRQAPRMGGWTIEDARVFLGALFISDSLWMILFSENLDRFSDKVRKGDLDLLLVKPVRSQFMMSCQKVGVSYIGNLIAALTWLTWSLLHVLDSRPDSVSLSHLLLFMLVIPCSVAVTYTLRFHFSAMALLFTRAENLVHVWYQFYKLGTRPDSFYPGWLRFILLSFIPVAFIASVPSRVLLENDSWPWLALSFVVAPICLWLTTRFWAYALTKYSSASS